MIVRLTSLIKQRISVPELSPEKKKNYLLIFLSMFNVASIIGLTFFQKITLTFSKDHIGISDNILFLTFLVCSFLICLLTWSILNKLDTIVVPKDERLIRYKKLILYIMTINILLYISCLSLVSFYTPNIKIDKLFISFVFLMKEINSILFIFNYMLFTFSLKFDLMYLHLNLNMRPDMEYFMESEKINYKSML